MVPDLFLRAAGDGRDEMYRTGLPHRRGEGSGLSVHEGVDVPTQPRAGLAEPVPEPRVLGVHLAKDG
jgi:hypothetical protein